MNEGIRPVEALALLSYRVGFYVSRPELAEELASGYLHYIVTVSDDRKFIRTRAPSEPILAYASATQTLQKPEFRSSIMGHFYSSITSGSTHVGDIGELVATFVTFVLLFTMHKILDPENYRPVSFTTFLETFVVPNVSSSVLAHMKASSELKAPLEDGTLFFNHFIHCPEPVTKKR